MRGLVEPGSGKRVKKVISITSAYTAEGRFRIDNIKGKRIYNTDICPLNSHRMFNTVTIFCKIFKSLILYALWICIFCDFMSYLAFWLYFGCMDSSHFLQSQGHHTESKRKPFFARQICYSNGN